MSCDSDATGITFRPATDSLSIRILVPPFQRPTMHMSILCDSPNARRQLFHGYHGSFIRPEHGTNAYLEPVEEEPDQPTQGLRGLIFAHADAELDFSSAIKMNPQRQTFHKVIGATAFLSRMKYSPSKLSA